MRTWVPPAGRTRPGGRSSTQRARRSRAGLVRPARRTVSTIYGLDHCSSVQRLVSREFRSKIHESIRSPFFIPIFYRGYARPRHEEAPDDAHLRSANDQWWSEVTAASLSLKVAALPHSMIRQSGPAPVGRPAVIRTASGSVRCREPSFLGYFGRDSIEEDAFESGLVVNGGQSGGLQPSQNSGHDLTRPDTT
jgi:hypothetical protein